MLLYLFTCTLDFLQLQTFEIIQMYPVVFSTQALKLLNLKSVHNML